MPRPSSASPSGVDVDGTFTDLAWVDEATGAVGNVLTTPQGPVHAVAQGVSASLHVMGRAGSRVEGAVIIVECESVRVSGPGADIGVDSRLALVAEPVR